jgi:hypothetical protein
MLDWIGDDFDPQAFSIDKVNRMLAPLSRHRRHRVSRRHSRTGLPRHQDLTR